MQRCSFCRCDLFEVREGEGGEVMSLWGSGGGRGAFAVLLLLAASFAGEARAEWTPDIVWKEDRIDCSNAQDQDGCLLETLRKGGASAAAIAFARELIARQDSVSYSGWATDFEEHGKVDLVGVFHPFRANTNYSYVLVNGRPPLIIADHYQLTPEDEARPAMKRILRKQPNAFVIRKPSFVRFEKLGGSMVRFVFEDDIAECRACEPLGYIRYGYVFDAAGAYKGASLLGMKLAARH